MEPAGVVGCCLADNKPKWTVGRFADNGYRSVECPETFHFYSRVDIGFLTYAELRILHYVHSLPRFPSLPTQAQADLSLVR